jgi:hypothetical protein
MDNKLENDLGDTLCDLKLWLERHLQNLKSDSNPRKGYLQDTKTDGHVVAEIPDWELRQKLTNINNCINLITQKDKVAEHPKDARGRFICSKEHPMPPNADGLWVHTEAESYGDDVYVDRYRCRTCGQHWKVEVGF